MQNFRMANQVNHIHTLSSRSLTSYSRNSDIYTRHLVGSEEKTVNTNNTSDDDHNCNCFHHNAKYRKIEPAGNTKTVMNLEPVKNINLEVPWDRLPEEILTKIFSYLSLRDTEVVEEICVSWKKSCYVPSLWKRLEFFFDGSDSLKLVSKGFRVFSSKGQFVRELVVKIGNPGLNQAWLMAECIQQLLDFITQDPSTSYIESFTLDNLVIFTQNRFFKLSKESTLKSLNTFIHSQKCLKRVNFTSCKFNPGEGLKLLRTLKSSGFRYSLQTLHLNNYFKRRSLTAAKAFKVLTAFPALEEIYVDAGYIDDNILRWMTEKDQKNPHRKQLRRLKIYFEAFKPPPTEVSRESWEAVRQHCPQGLQVSYHIGGWLSYQWIKPFLMNCVPLVEIVLVWEKKRRIPKEYMCDLIFLLEQLSSQHGTLLETFSLTTSTRPLPSLEGALVGLMSCCRQLTEVRLYMKLSEQAADTISSILSTKTRPVKLKCSLWPGRKPAGQSAATTSPGPQLRSRGC